MKRFEITLTFAVETESADGALELARIGLGTEINHDIFEVPACKNCGAFGAKEIVVDGVDELGAATSEVRCEKCAGVLA